jgi:hypothetical protein
MNCSCEQLVSDPAITCIALSGPMADGSHPTAQQAVALYVAVDRSGSMASANKLDNVKLSLDQLLTYMNGGDFFTVLAFDHLVNTTIDCEDCSPDHKVIMQRRLAALHPGGSTHLEAAIKAGGAAMDKSLPIRYGGPIKKAFVLLTDGDATAGELSPVRLLEFQQAIQAAHPDAQLSAIGYGDDHNVALVQSLAISGTYSIVRTVEDVAAVFGDILGGLRTATAQAVKVVVPPHVNQKTTLKQTIRPDGFKEIFVGNIIAGGDQMVVLEGLTAADPVRLEYTRVADGVAVVLPVVVSGPTSEGQSLGDLALYRCKVVAILEQVQRHLLSGSRVVEATLLEQILTLQATLRSLSETSTTAMLLRELDRAHTYLTMPLMPPSMGRQVSNMLSQHTQVLGTARGIMSSGGDEDDDDPGRNVSLFASSVQRTISVAMTEGVRSASAAASNPPPSLFITPTNSRTPTEDTTTVFPPPGSLHRS